MNSRCVVYSISIATTYNINFYSRELQCLPSAVPLTFGTCMHQVMGHGSRSVEMSTSPTKAFKFAKINGENYALWFQHMQLSLQACYLWLIVTGDEPCPKKHSDTQPLEPTVLTAWKVTNKEWLDWLLRDQAAQGLMKGVAEPSQWPHIVQTKTGKEMWDAWKKMYITNQQHINISLLLRGPLHMQV